VKNIIIVVVEIIIHVLNSKVLVKKIIDLNFNELGLEIAFYNFMFLFKIFGERI